MFLVYVGLVISAINLILWVLTTLEIKHEFVRRYPDLRIPKGSTAGTISAVIKIIFMSICPILHLITFWTLMFNSDDVKEKTIANVHKKAIRVEEDKR